nr:hypothetical protein [Tanacetum cinerariifolium]
MFLLNWRNYSNDIKNQINVATELEIAHIGK